MGQPIRKKIKEKYPESEGNIYTLLVDGTNLLKISMVDDKINNRGEHIGGVFQFLLQLKKMLSTRLFDYVYVFFDDEHSGVLRYNIYQDYKANRDKNYQNSNLFLSSYMQEVNKRNKEMLNYFKTKQTPKVKDIDDKKEIEKLNFKRERDILCEYFNELFIRWMIDENTEVDDLISHYVINKKKNEKIIIMSTDHDLTQLLSDDVYIYNSRLKKNITHLNFQNEFGYPYQNVLIKKILCGDTSDNISNISGLSENKLFELIPEIKNQIITLDMVKNKAKMLNEERINNKKKPLKYCDNILNGISNKDYNGDFYEINKKIIDLLNPLLTQEAIDELNEISYTPQNTEDRTFGNLYKLIIRDDIIDLIDDKKFSSFFATFQPFINKEKKKYEDYLLV